MLTPPRAVSFPDDLLISYSPPLEDEIIPSVEAIASAAEALDGLIRNRAARLYDGPVFVDGWEQPLNLGRIAPEDHEAARELGPRLRDAG